MEEYNGRLCISGSELIISEKNPNGIIPKTTYANMKGRGQITTVRRGCLNSPALYEVHTLPKMLKDLINEKLGIPEEVATLKPFKDKVVADAAAVEYYSNYMLADGRHLPAMTAREYSANASVLNGIAQEKANSLKSGNSRGFWGKAMMAVNNMRVEKGHSLPSNERALSRLFEAYTEGVWREPKGQEKYFVKGYEALISGKFCNDNSRKVSDKIENLLMSLYVMPNKPFQMDVYNMYLIFITGKLQVADRNTGELLNPQDFIFNGKPLELSATTVKNYLSQPKNRVIENKVRSGGHHFSSNDRPHHHRYSPNYSFSKISMDDRDLPRKCDNGKRVKAYYAYDVTSGCRIGSAYSFDKNEELFLECMRDMFRMIEKNGFGMPMEVEVEHHLVNKFFDDLANMFPFMRICNPGNSQEKRAEHLNRAAKMGFERKTQVGVGRWHAKHEAYRVDQDKVNDEFVEKTFSYSRLVADDMQVTIDFNNQLHPKQKKYPGKTRWQVLVENMNPAVSRPNKSLVYKCIGEHTPSTIMRNQYCTVQYNKYQIANVQILDRLLPNNYSVDAYYLPDAEGLIDEVYLYQAGVYLCKAERIVAYNESKAESTHIDKDGYMHQSKYVSSFDSMAKKGKEGLMKVVVMKEETISNALEQAKGAVVVPEVKIDNADLMDDVLIENNVIDYRKRALDNQ